ncbi:DUF803-domain-containing protein [Punctularia strigosozonata HHB-11173 SS5]|uniref:DUF803-domain-containing protein n=1 Tax=Punctularia strigosozonata (strain HHB-11173) TaxID=741275 RepID=UPI00044186B1|nr:DUF803-domain-containing protein [Punctularia strigosozonata HHB-11173 SS5]EIN11244.1 DUF803-domain-containing protein [Punctularia strigosozonata HHB-11173 SS5]
MTSTTSASASASTTASASFTVGSNLKVVGIILAVASGLLIGSSFVFKKKGLLRAQAGHAAGEGVAYLKSPLWWLGMTMMILGELCNFAAYAFVEAIVVTPMGALSVVICAILSSLFLNEKLSLFGWLGCILCILGSTIIALNGPKEQSVGQITKFQKLFLAPGFLAYGGTLIAISLAIVFYFAPRYGKKNMLWYIMVCSMIGGISVSVTTGLGAAIVTTASGDNQFKHWFLYFLMVFVAVTLITEVYYLNVALALFNTAMVTPTYYVIFTFFSMLTTIVLFQGLSASVTQILTIVMAFFTICVGITILQMSKVDPTQFKSLDRRSTMLLQAARAHTQEVDEEKLTGVEDPGIDALRGSFGTMGSIIRAKSARRLSMSSRASTLRSRPDGARHREDREHGLSATMSSQGEGGLRDGMRRHRLFDNPMPDFDAKRGSEYSHRSDAELRSVALSDGVPPLPGTPQQHPNRTPTIKFDNQDLVHQYDPALRGPSAATHERRPNVARGTSAYSGSSIVASPKEEIVEIVEQPSRENLLGGTDESEDEAARIGVVKARSPDRLYRPHARDPFERGGGVPADSLDSIATQAGAESTDEEERTEGRGLTTPKRGFAGLHLPAGNRNARTPSPRRYPKGPDQEDDLNESIGLWHRANDSLGSDPEDDQRTVRPEHQRETSGGIRLVTRPPVGSTDRF